jgi:PAS domain S-box-containing protein
VNPPDQIEIRNPAAGFPPAWRRFGLAILATLGATGMRALVDDSLKDAYPFLFSFAAVAAAAAYGGWRPALLALVLSYLIDDWCFIPPRGQFTLFLNREGVVAFIGFSATSLIIMVFAEAMRRAGAMAARHAGQFGRERERLRVTLASIAEAVIATDAEGTVTFMNPIASKLTGWPPEEARGKPLHEIFHITDETTGQRAENPVDHVLSESRILGLPRKTLLRCRTNGQHAIAATAAPIAGKAGHVEGVVLVFRDISEERRAEDASRRQNERAHLLSRMLENLLAARNADEILTDVCPLVAKHLDADVCFNFMTTEDGDACRLHFCTGIPEEVARALYRCTHGHSRSDPPEMRKETQERELLHRVGVKAFATSTMMAGGRVLSSISFGSTTRDRFDPDEEDFLRTISHYAALAVDRLQSERRLIQRENRLAEQARLLNLSNDAIIVCDVDDRIMYWNHGAEEIYGWTSREATGQIKYELLRTEFSLPQDQIRTELYRTGRWNGELSQLCKDGRRIIVSTRWSLDRDTLGEPAAVLKSDNDITERKEVELLLEQQAASLRESDRRKDEFLAMLAHELRNPLASVSNAATLLDTPDETATHEWAVSVIRRQAGQLARLIDDLLDVSRITSGKIQLRKTLVDAPAVARSAVEAARPLIDERKHTLVFKEHAKPWALPIEADPTRLEQIILNLLTNAAKYTERGGTIWLDVDREIPVVGEPEMVIRVRDTGIGIPPDRIPDMFKLFSQGERSIARSEGGLGIGLTIVQKLCELHGGTVEAHSKGVGQGSEFVVRLPAPDIAPANFVTRSAPKRQAKRNLNGIKVLVVDDNVDTARGLSRLLEISGYTVNTVHSGAEAIDTAHTFQPDFVLLDIGLPGMDGYEVCRRLRQNSLGSSAGIIAISGYGQDEDRKRSREAGFDAHLVKPVDLDELKDLLVRPAAAS